MWLKYDIDGVRGREIDELNARTKIELLIFNIRYNIDQFLNIYI